MAQTANRLAQQAADPMAPLHQGLEMALAQHQKFKETRNLLDHIREGMDRLTRLGDLVTPEDVISEAGKMVGHGVPAPTMAEILSEMPDQGGQGLAAWIKMHDLNITHTEIGLEQQAAVHQHRLGVAALKAMAGEHIKSRSQAMGKQGGQQGGQLGVQGQGAGPQGGGPSASILQVAEPPGEGGQQ